MVQRKKKVCIYCERWSRGGIEAFLARTMAHMDLNGLELHLAVAEWQSGVFQAELSHAGVVCHILHKRQNTGACGRTFYSLKPFWKLLHVEMFDVVHLNIFHGAALSFALLARWAKVHTVIVHSHGAGLRKSKGYWLKLLAHRLCCDFFSGVSAIRWAASIPAGKFMFTGSEQVRVIPNGIDPQQFLFSSAVRWEMRQKLGFGSAYVIGCVGRLENQKNQIFLINVLAECIINRPQTVLLLVGGGEARTELEKSAMHLGLREHVCFIGESDRIPALLCAMDVFAVPSLSEGLGIVAIEAQAAGLPVICSSGVPAEVQITDSVTFLPLEKGAKAWAECILSQKPLDRARQNSLVGNSCFHIRNSADMVRKGYLGEDF